MRADGFRNGDSPPITLQPRFTIKIIYRVAELYGDMPVYEGEISKDAKLWCSACRRTTKHHTDIACRSWDAGYIDCTMCGRGRKLPA